MVSKHIFGLLEPNVLAFYMKKLSLLAGIRHYNPAHPSVSSQKEKIFSVACPGRLFSSAEISLVPEISKVKLFRIIIKNASLFLDNY